jgi:hypothetical protein
MSSVAYWYGEKATKVARPPAVAKRLPVLRDNQGNWLHDARRRCPGQPVRVTPEMRKLKRQWATRKKQ